eukprot:GILI01004548.1.p1 GENE.GILI01004548.1~~GILI01004548.1.p1  ORF type:complete len:391 (+),score=99.60 GILI01004548.1:76-1248(+)
MKITVSALLVWLLATSVVCQGSLVEEQRRHTSHHSASNYAAPRFRANDNRNRNAHAAQAVPLQIFIPGLNLGNNQGYNPSLPFPLAQIASQLQMPSPMPSAAAPASKGPTPFSFNSVAQPSTAFVQELPPASSSEVVSYSSSESSSSQSGSSGSGKVFYMDQDKPSISVAEEVSTTTPAVFTGGPSTSTSTSSSSQMRGNVSHTFKPDFSSTFITGTVSTHEPAINKSLEYLKKARLKKKAEEQALLIAVDKGRREFEYDCLHKMGEANEMSAILGLGISYRANKLESGELRCHLYDGAQFLREITLEAFMREFRRVKKKMDTVKPSALAQKDVSVSDSVNSSKPASNKVNKKARQEELKQVLLETMQLTNKLKEQLLILERKGGNFSPY